MRFFLPNQAYLSLFSSTAVGQLLSPAIIGFFSSLICHSAMPLSSVNIRRPQPITRSVKIPTIPCLTVIISFTSLLPDFHPSLTQSVICQLLFHFYSSSIPITINFFTQLCRYREGVQHKNILFVSLTVVIRLISLGCCICHSWESTSFPLPISLALPSHPSLLLGPRQGECSSFLSAPCALRDHFHTDMSSRTKVSPSPLSYTARIQQVCAFGWTIGLVSFSCCLFLDENSDRWWVFGNAIRNAQAFCRF